MVVSGPKHRASSYIEGLDILANMRLCANVPGQHAIQAALGNTGAADELVLPGARLVEQRDRAWELLNAIPGVSCVKPMGALYTFPRLDPSVHRIQDDERLVLDLLRREHILVVQGTGFNWPRPDHLRIVTLPAVEELADAIVRIGTFLADYRQPSS
jgi:alanine-synthesizing transaminase